MERALVISGWIIVACCLAWYVAAIAFSKQSGNAILVTVSLIAVLTIQYMIANTRGTWRP